MTDGPKGEPGPLLRRALLDKPLTLRRAALMIATTSLLLTLGSGTVVWLLDEDGIGSLGDSFWWALQTVTTVGYGDVVPQGTVGRVAGAILMLTGIALISVVTAIVTAMLVEQARRRHGRGVEAEMVATLERIETRLDEIESRMEPRG